jgi:hypothetical protein
MPDMKNKLLVRHWWRQRLAELGAQYPELKEPERQQRLTEALEKEGTPCRESQQDEDEGDHQEVDN